jgi:hypothetical protein
MSSLTKKTFYICGVAWEHHLGETPEMLYNTKKELKSKVPCWEECGIIKVEMKGKWTTLPKKPKPSSKR